MSSHSNEVTPVGEGGGTTGKDERHVHHWVVLCELSVVALGCAMACRDNLLCSVQIECTFLRKHHAIFIYIYIAAEFVRYM